MKFNSVVKIAVISLLIVSSLSSCIVSKKKYDDLLNKKLKLESDFADCETAKAKLQGKKDSLVTVAGRLSNKIESLKDDSVKKETSLKRFKRLYDDETLTSERLRDELKLLSEKSTTENATLAKKLAKREEELNHTLAENEKLAQNLKDRELKVQELEKVLKEKENAVNALKTKVSNALLSFAGKDLSVNVKNGKVYVSLSDQLLFKSGSTDVDAKGADALKKLATVLKDNNEVNVLVEGHTDDVPITKGTKGMQDNWDLSVLRATSIVRILLDGGVQPFKLTPSGKGEFSPIVEGKTPEARQKNRQTEIILTPKLDELFKILE